MTPQRKQKNMPKIFWLGKQIFDHAGRLGMSNKFQLSNGVNPFRGMEEFKEKSLPPELKALCRKSIP